MVVSVAEEKSSKMNTFFVRTASALVMAPLALAAIHFGTPYYELLILLGASAVLWEWFSVTGCRAQWQPFGLVYVLVTCSALLWLRLDDVWGLATIYWLFSLVWATDIGAYLSGMTIGGPKLAPRISPKKTWAGLIGGMTSAGIVGAVAASMLDIENMISLALISAAIGGASQGGDLFQSWVKRTFAVKDSSQLIPGHGGVWDRVDGLLVAALVIATINAFGAGSVLSWL